MINQSIGTNKRLFLCSFSSIYLLFLFIYLFLTYLLIFYFYFIIFFYLFYFALFFSTCSAATRRVNLNHHPITCLRAGSWSGLVRGSPLFVFCFFVFVFVFCHANSISFSLPSGSRPFCGFILSFGEKYYFKLYKFPLVEEVIGIFDFATF